jgi:undecaprenyl-diphosphatase
VYFQDHIESLFTGNLILVGSSLILTSALLFFTYFKSNGKKEVSYLESIMMGIAQTIAILPGISRSGATIATGLLIGVDKVAATRFSFLMVLPPILGASLLNLKDYLSEPMAHQGISSLSLIVGFVAALISGYFACSWMTSIVRRGKLYYFAIYCIIVGLIAIISQI